MYTVGIDGGGTKTELILVGDDGQVVAQVKAGGLNSNYVPEEQQREHVQALLNELCSQFNQFDDVAGVYTVMVGGEFHNILQRYFVNAEISSVGEYLCALAAGGDLEPRGVAIIAGTGSGVFGWNGMENHFGVGGWGMTLGDEGGATDIAVQAFKAAVRAQDGRGAKTEILPEMMRFFKMETLWFMPRALSHQIILRHEFAAFSAVVGRLANEGDAVAQRLMREAGESLAADAVFVCGRLFKQDDTFPVVLSGGVFKCGHWNIDPIVKAVGEAFPNVDVHQTIMPPAQAAALMARNRLQHGMKL